MENQNKNVVFIYSSWTVLTLNIILLIYFLLSWLFLFTTSYYKFVTLPFFTIFSYTKRLFIFPSLSQKSYNLTDVLFQSWESQE